MHRLEISIQSKWKTKTEHYYHGMFGCVWASHYRSERQKMSENQLAHTIKLETNTLILLHQHNHQHNICITRLAMGLNTIRCMLFWAYSLTSFVDTSSYFSGFKNSVLFLFVSYYLFPLFCFVLFCLWPINLEILELYFTHQRLALFLCVIMCVKVSRECCMASAFVCQFFTIINTDKLSLTLI